MAAFVFPESPTNGQRYPANPGLVGAAQYEWVASKGVWNVVPNFIRTNNQLAYNSYSWGSTVGPIGTQLTRVGSVGLSWEASGGGVTQLLAGTNITLSPTNGLGAVTISSTGGGGGGTPSFAPLQLLESFNGSRTVFTLVESGTVTPFSPNPVTNIFISVGGVPQVYGASYQVAGSQLTFTEAPITGATFLGYSLVSA